MTDHFDFNAFLNDVDDEELEMVTKLREPILPEEPALAIS
jgi:hypothetical protein